MNFIGEGEYLMVKLENFKGGTLVEMETEDSNGNTLYKLKFKGSDDDIQQFMIEANSIIFLKRSSSLDGVFKTVNIDSLKGKKLLEYEDWHIEEFADTGNLSGPQYNLTLTFEDGYSIDIMGFTG